MNLLDRDRIFVEIYSLFYFCFFVILIRVSGDYEPLRSKQEGSLLTKTILVAIENLAEKI